MQRVLVVGTSCSGKTTLANRLAQVLDLHHVELDALYWSPNWTPVESSIFHRRLQQALAAPCWVVDGNYSMLRSILWPAATHLIWLNYPFLTVFWRALRRTSRRVFTQEELFGGNRETLRNALFERDSILWWVIRTHHALQRTYRDLIASKAYPHLNVLGFTNPRQTENWLQHQRDDPVLG